MAGKNQKLKMLYLAKLFMEETDETHGLTQPQIIDKMHDVEVDVERKTLYSDIKALQTFGLDIEKRSHCFPVQYGLASRDFDEGQLMLLADAVQSSKFLTKRKSDALVKSISKLGSRHMAAALKRRVHIEGRIKMQNESVFYSLDAIQQALNNKRKIEFRYFRYGVAKKPIMNRDSQLYVETPVQLMYMDGCYYLVVWNDKYEDFAIYRIDRMRDPRMSEEPATRNEKIASFDVAKFEQRVFNMFAGEPVKVTLRVKAPAMNAVIDRFGKEVDAVAINDDEAMVHAWVMESPTFYGWLAQFCGDVILEKPTSTREAYLAFLQKIVDSYK